VRIFFRYLSLFSIFILLSTCKKYDDGGLLRLTRKHLFGGNDAGDNKTWKLDKYEVNGIDSTNLINTGGLPDFYENFVTFTLSDKREYAYEVNNHIYRYYGQIDLSYKQLLMALNKGLYSNTDSTQCSGPIGSQTCVRSTLNPEVNINPTKVWTIKKLTKKHLVLETDYRLQNSYRIELSNK
jgi:hypothetical protein